MSIQRKQAENLKSQWREMWNDRLVDKQRAEGIAADDYLDLFIEKGTVLHATRDFKALTFNEILQKHQFSNNGFEYPASFEGGYGAFIRQTFKKRERKTVENLGISTRKGKSPQKTASKGWLSL